MKNTVVDRDPYEQLKFGKYLEDFSNTMRTSCRGVKNHLNDARDNIQHDEAVKAMDELDALMDNILNLLPGIEEFGTRQITLAKPIIEAEGKKFKR